jgi:hypothetical protein
MPESYYSDFGDYLTALEKRGKLYRWSRAVNKDSDLMPRELSVSVVNTSSQETLKK